MKRYLVFGGSDYYPAGGWSDFQLSTDDLEEAKNKAVKFDTPYMWYQIIDIEDFSEVNL